MADLARYRKKKSSRVVAVQLDLDTDGFTYEKWGGTQTCKAGDWLVDNAGEVYTVDRESFEHSYRAVGPGVYEKFSDIWAEVAEEPGKIKTKEGVTEYEAGHYLVYNDADRKDGYAMDAETFNRMYTPAE